MDAALHINPYYGKTSRDGLIYHFSAVLDYGPTIVYNVPARAARSLTNAMPCVWLGSGAPGRRARACVARRAPCAGCAIRVRPRAQNQRGPE